MPKEVAELMIRRVIELDGQLDNLDPGSPEYERIIREMESLIKLLQSDYNDTMAAIDMEEKRKIDESFKIEQLKNERRRCRTEIAKVLIQSGIAAGASIGGATLLIKVKTAIEKDGYYLGPDLWKQVYNFILKIKS